MTIFIPRWMFAAALLGAFGAAVYGIAIPLVRIALWCGKAGCA